MNEIFVILSRTKFQRILLVVIIAAVYGVSLGHDFVWDDKVFFIGNPVYSQFNLEKIFFSLANGAEYLPVRDLTYALDYLFWGENPFGFHLTNLLFFMGNILLILHFTALVLKRLARLAGRDDTPLLPFAVAALFALHPINAEVVNFVTCRNVLVSATFVFISCIAMFRFFEDGGRRFYLVSLAAFILAMFGKATAIMLPLLFLLFFPILFPGHLKRIAIALLPFFVISSGFFILFKSIADSVRFTNVTFQDFNLWRKLAIAVQIPFFYLQKLLIPVGFSAEYATDFSASLLSGRGIASFVGFAVIVVAAVLLKRKCPEFTAGIVWFIAALIPVLNILNTHPIVADRYSYLPTFGVIFAVVTTVARISPVKLCKIAFSATLLVYVVLSADRSLAWRSDESLWGANIKNYPKETKSYVNLANAYFRMGEQQRALDLLAKNSSVPWLNVFHDYFLGRYYYQSGDFVRAKEALQKPLGVLPGYIGSLYYLGNIAEKEGDLFSAVQYYNRAIASVEPDSFFQLPEIRGRLKIIRENSVEPQLMALRQNIATNPADLAARRELGLTLDRLGFYEEALEQYHALVRGGVTAWQIYQNIANCYFNLNKAAEAITYYEKVISLGGGVEDTFNNLGIAYRTPGKYAQSINALQQGVRKFPDSAYPAFNLAVSYYASGQKEQALAAFAAVEQKFPEFKDRIAPYLKMLAS